MVERQALTKDSLRYEIESLGIRRFTIIVANETLTRPDTGTDGTAQR
jgi:hypothetical protein